MKKLLAWLLLIAILVPAAAVAEDWEHEEPDYLEVERYEYEWLVLTGYLQQETRWNGFAAGSATAETIYCLYVDQPLDFTMLRPNGGRSACQMEFVQITSGKDLSLWAGERVTVEGIVRFADGSNGLQTAVALTDADITPVSNDEVFSVEEALIFYDPEYGVDAMHDAAELTGDAHLRDYHGLSGYSLGVIKKGERVIYYGLTEYDDRGVAWYNVYHDKFGSGWVSSKYAKLTYGLNGENTAIGYVYADGGKSNMRKGPGLDYKIWCTFKKGDTAIYLGNDAWDDRGVQWYNIRYRDYEGWVSSKYTSLIVLNQPWYEDWNVRATGNVYVRTGPGLGYGICDVFKPGREEDFLGDTYYDDRGVAWYSVSCKGGQGWISSRYSELVED